VDDYQRALIQFNDRG